MLFHNQAVFEHIDSVFSFTFPARMIVGGYDKHVSIFTDLATALPSWDLFSTLAVHRILGPAITFLAIHRVVGTSKIAVMRRVPISEIAGSCSATLRAILLLSAFLRREFLATVFALNSFLSGICIRQSAIPTTETPAFISYALFNYKGLMAPVTDYLNRSRILRHFFLPSSMIRYIVHHGRILVKYGVA